VKGEATDLLAFSLPNAENEEGNLLTRSTTCSAISPGRVSRLAGAALS